MSYDGLVTGAIAHQLQKTLAGGKIDKIYQPEKDELIFHIHSGREKNLLYISANGSNARMHLIENDRINPQNPPAFCMLLRKYFQGGKINNIYQVESERIIEILVDHFNEMGFYVQRKLIIEIMGKHSNIIAIDIASNKIIDSIKRISLDVNRYRQILPGLSYISPPNQGKINCFTITENKMDEILKIKGETGETPSKALVSGIQGISPTISEEICFQASQKYQVNLEEMTAKQLYPVIVNFISSLQSENIKPVVYLDKNRKPLDFHIFPLSGYEDHCEKIIFNNISEAVDYFYSNKVSSNLIRQKSSDLTKTINSNLDKLYLKKQRLCEDVLRAEKGDTFRLYGELITANLYKIPSGAKSISVLNYYNNKQLEIPLDPRFSSSQNAQKYFKKYNKTKTAIKEKNIQLVETNESIAYLESVLSFIENADTIEEIEGIRQELIENNYLKKQKKHVQYSKSKLKLCSYFTTDGFQLLVGRNNKENDRLTFNLADKKDLWFHTKDIPGSHIILLTEGKQPTKESLLEAASLAAYYSKARFSENVPVDYTYVRNVKKPAGAKPGMVIFTDNHTLYVKPSCLLKKDI